MSHNAYWSEERLLQKEDEDQNKEEALSALLKIRERKEFISNPIAEQGVTLARICCTETKL
jgi:hypothetical protein